MDSRADGARELRKEILEPRHEALYERLEVRSPGSSFGIVPASELRREAQRPGPAVRPFERSVALDVEVLRLGRHRLRREMSGQARADLLLRGHVRHRL